MRIKNISVFVRQVAKARAFNSTESWVVLSDIEQAIKEKIEHKGTLLKNWNIQINYGIKTGFNEAFIINGAKRQELIDQDPRSNEIIRPILRGRDIKRYGYTFEEKYLIATFPSKSYNIDDYPAVKIFLSGFKPKLNQTAQPLKKSEVEQIISHANAHNISLHDGDLKNSRKKTNNKWFETQDSISYWDDFSKQKIVWGEISDKTKFSIDLTGNFLNEATTFLMVGDSLIYLLGYLNSKLSEWVFSKIATTTGVGTVRWKKFTIEQLPVPKLEEAVEKYCQDIILKIINLTDKNEDCVEWERKFNDEIYKSIGLTREEIIFIESQ